MVLFQRLVLIIVLVRGSMQMIWFCQTIIPARDPEHCGRSKQIMYSYVDDDVNVEDDVDDDGDGDDDGVMMMRRRMMRRMLMMMLRLMIMVVFLVLVVVVVVRVMVI
jgi:hypothetical protein